MSGLTTHALDTALGRPAAGMAVEIWRTGEGEARRIRRLLTNAAGRTDRPLLGPDEIRPGRYRLVFGVGAYLRATGSPEGLFEDVPVDVVIESTAEHHHVPLLVSPFGYSTYRGS